MTTLYIDGDACPVRDEVYRVADRLGLPVFVVANGSRPIRPTGRPNVTMITVEAGADVADDWIAERVTKADVCITSDIPLASRCLAKGGRALSPNGKIWTPDNIGNALAGREVGRYLREMGLNTGGPAPLTKQDRSHFLSALDTLVRAAQRERSGMTDKVLGRPGRHGSAGERAVHAAPDPADPGRTGPGSHPDHALVRPPRSGPHRRSAGTGPDPLPWLLRGINGLRRPGAAPSPSPATPPMAGSTRWPEAAGVPILHIVDAAAADLRRIGITRGTIGLMGTATTLAMRLYQQRLGAQGWDIIEPEPAQMERLVTPAIALVKANRVAEAYQPLVEVVNSLASRGATAVVLGCTEIPLGIQAGPADALRCPVVDTIDALARAAIAWAQPNASTGAFD